jgi:hypothetical protein
MLTDLGPASGLVLLTMLLAHWKMPTTNLRSHSRTLRAAPSSPNTWAIVTMIFHSFHLFGRPTKERIFVMDVFKWVPEGLITWIFERDQRPGMVRVLENRKLAHEVAAKLIEAKRQELKDGTPRKDFLTLLGSSRAAFWNSDIRYNTELFSQSKFRPATRMATQRRRNFRSSSVGGHLWLSVKIIIRGTGRLCSGAIQL